MIWAGIVAPAGPEVALWECVGNRSVEGPASADAALGPKGRSPGTEGLAKMVSSKISPLAARAHHVSVWALRFDRVECVGQLRLAVKKASAPAALELESSQVEGALALPATLRFLVARATAIAGSSARVSAPVAVAKKTSQQLPVGRRANEPVARQPSKFRPAPHARRG